MLETVFVFFPKIRAALPVGAAILNAISRWFKNPTKAAVIEVFPVPAAPHKIMKSSLLRSSTNVAIASNASFCSLVGVENCKKSRIDFIITVSNYTSDD